MKHIWVNGCFDVLHRGHIELFKFAKSLGNRLIVGIDSDDKVTKDKDDRVARKWSDEIRYEIRNYIREVNIHIHGNYAHVDRMVIQTHWLGQLAAQFHKWAPPTWKQRFRKEYA